MLLYLVRHGETDWNRDRRIQGRTDIPLNSEGRRQAAATGALLARHRWDALYTSPLSRAFETADIIAAQLALSPPIAVPELVERNYGAVEGMTAAEVDATYPPGTDVPGRESPADVVARALPALLSIAERHAAQRVIVVAHGGLIRAILGAVDPTGSHGVISNGSIHSFRYRDGSFDLLVFDDPIDDASLEISRDDIEVQNALEGREAHSAAL